MSISLRKATQDDAPFLAMCLMEAMGGNIFNNVMNHSLSKEMEKRLALLTEVCRREDTLYTWLSGTIAQNEEGTLLGASIAYDGKEYHSRRMKSFSMSAKIISFDIEKMEDEACEGEFYLDTLAVVPSFRGQGIGHLLLDDWLKKADTLRLRPTIIYHPRNTRARQVYESIGMRDSRPIFIFGDYYMKMERK